jgi:hypothetical protein
MITFKIPYKFENGTRIELTVQHDKSNPIANCEWTGNKKPSVYEYRNIFVPMAYQKIANFIGGTIMWIDPDDIENPQIFKPNNKN